MSKGRSSCKKDSHKKKASVKGGIGKEKKIKVVSKVKKKIIYGSGLISTSCPSAGQWESLDLLAFEGVLRFFFFASSIFFPNYNHLYWGSIYQERH